MLMSNGLAAYPTVERYETVLSNTDEEISRLEIYKQQMAQGKQKKNVSKSQKG